MPFVAVNCGAITESLMEAEFFGYRRGAFTGADRDRDGFYQAAAGGTLFLDEIAELPLAMQVKLLRAIQERRVRKVGATTEDPVDVRILCATHQELRNLVASGRFRQDLFYRLNVIELRVPSLRERDTDIPLIARSILQRIAERAAQPPARLSEAAARALQRHPFPGNVRELENVLERALALSPGGELQVADLTLLATMPLAEPAATAQDDGDEPERSEPIAAPAGHFEMRDGVPSDLEAYLGSVEREAIRVALSRTANNRTAAAQLLGISFRQMRYRMRRLGIG
jgi:two-component system response regulator PilR (NtrC family)